MDWKSPQRRVVRGTVASLLAVSFFAATVVAVAQQDDPSEVFLKAYLSAQQGEKLEREDRLRSALAKYRFAGSLVDYHLFFRFDRLLFPFEAFNIGFIAS